MQQRALGRAASKQWRQCCCTLAAFNQAHVLLLPLAASPEGMHSRGGRGPHRIQQQPMERCAFAHLRQPTARPGQQHSGGFLMQPAGRCSWWALPAPVVLNCPCHLLQIIAATYAISVGASQAFSFTSPCASAGQGAEWRRGGTRRRSARRQLKPAAQAGFLAHKSMQRARREQAWCQEQLSRQQSASVLDCARHRPPPPPLPRALGR